jgi:hypothetical protein
MMNALSLAGKATLFAWIGVTLFPVDPSFAGTEMPILPPISQAFQVKVNSLNDGEIRADADLTLREAIEVTNGTLSLDDLSEAERAQVRPLAAGEGSQISWSGLTGEPVLLLSQPLPPLAQVNLRLDGAVNDRRVQIRPAESVVIPRGLTILADGVTVQNLVLQGFSNPNTTFGSGFNVDNAPDWVRPNVLSGAIVITQGEALYDLQELPWIAQLTPPRGVEITGIGFGGDSPGKTAFGVVIFDGLESQIHGNIFQGLQGSAILTGKQASGSQIYDNEMIGNGGAGMPDAIRLEGTIEGMAIYNNRICENAGSGIFLFKPQGSISIRDNDIHFNGTGSDRGAIYLTGSGHEVVNNYISHQFGGGGVVVAAYPRSVQNRIQDNRFVALDGLSIDLVMRRQTGVWDNAIGDGVNPPRDSGNRRLDTANRGINAPEFVGDELFLFDDAVAIAGQADPGSTVDIYKVSPGSMRTSGADFRQYAPLTELLVSVPVDPETGRFEISLPSLQEGDRLSAIATDPALGTSEPAKNAVIRTIDANPNRTLPVSTTGSDSTWDIPCGATIAGMMLLSQPPENLFSERSLYNPVAIPQEAEVIGDDPLQIALGIFGVKEKPVEGNFSEVVDLTEETPQRVIVTLTQTGFLDDSVKGHRYRLEFLPEGEQWKLNWAGRQNQCYRSPTGDWTTDLCP